MPHPMITKCQYADIEDKGTSGQTFLAAVEYLEQEQPAVALFENVDNAPWVKMQEYICGRLDLSQRNDIKNITEIKKNQAGECLIPENSVKKNLTHVFFRLQTT